MPLSAVLLMPLGWKYASIPFRMMGIFKAYFLSLFLAPISVDRNSSVNHGLLGCNGMGIISLLVGTTNVMACHYLKCRVKLMEYCTFLASLEIFTHVYDFACTV